MFHVALPIVKQLMPFAFIFKAGGARAPDPEETPPVRFVEVKLTEIGIGMANTPRN